MVTKQDVAQCLGQLHRINQAFPGAVKVQCKKYDACIEPLFVKASPQEQAKLKESIENCGIKQAGANLQMAVQAYCQAVQKLINLG